MLVTKNYYRQGFPGKRQCFKHCIVHSLELQIFYIYLRNKMQDRIQKLFRLTDKERSNLEKNHLRVKRYQLNIHFFKYFV